jgi:hypothetical protein
VTAGVGVDSLGLGQSSIDKRVGLFESNDCKSCNEWLQMRRLSSLHVLSLILGRRGAHLTSLDGLMHLESTRAKIE